jgi:hypothetical protein
MLIDAGVNIGGVTVDQPADIDGDVKLLNALTMENIADAAVSDNLATRDKRAIDQRTFDPMGGNRLSVKIMPKARYSPGRLSSPLTKSFANRSR